MRNLKYTMLHFGGRYILLFTAIAALTLSACKKDDKDEQGGNSSSNLSVDSITGTHEIYVALSFDSIYSSGHSHSYAAYYHNGLKLLPQTTNSDAYANSIFVEDTNVYVGGSDGTSAVYWKNGEENVLPQGTSVSSIYVRNGVVYACGYEATSTGNSARCWVGDENVKELDGTIAEGITVDRNGTVYVTGYYENQANELEYLRYWVSNSDGGMSRFQIDPTSDSQDACEGRAICLDYSHFKDNRPFICIGGTEYNRGGYINQQWVERKPSQLAKASGNLVYGAYAYGGVLYTCGNDAKKASYWMGTINSDGSCNDIKAIGLTAGSYEAKATSIMVRNGNVYTTGYEVPGTGQSINNLKLWKDGVEQDNFFKNMGTLNATPNGLFVTIVPTSTK
jgi:hypothetical protein